MRKSLKTEILNIDGDYHIYEGMGKYHGKKYEVQIIRETYQSSKMKNRIPVLWVDVHRNWIEDNDDAFDTLRTEMFKSMSAACKHLEIHFNLDPRTKKKLMKFKHWRM